MADINEQWHLKREVPIATIMTLVVAIASAAYFLAEQSNELKILRNDFINHVEVDNARLERQDARDALILESLRAIESDVVAIRIKLAKHNGDN